MHTQEIELSELKARLQSSALRPVEQGVFLVFWLLAHGGGRSLVEGRVVDAAVLVLKLAGFSPESVEQWVGLAARLGFTFEQCQAIDAGLRLSIVPDLADVGGVDELLLRGRCSVDANARVHVRRLRGAAGLRDMLADLAKERSEEKERQRKRALQSFAELERMFPWTVAGRAS